MRQRPLLSMILLLLLSAAYCQQPESSTKPEEAPPAKVQEKAPEKTNISAWDVLNEGLTADDSAKRAEAVSALSIAGQQKQIVGLAESFLQDKDAGVRQAAVATLGELASRRSIPKLRQALEDESDEVSFSAASVLWKLGDSSGRQVLIEVLAGERKTSGSVVHGKVQELKKKMRNPAALALFGVRQAGVLGPFGIGLSLAEELRKDKSAAARVLAADALANDRNQATAQDLEAALADKNWAVRAAAAHGVAKRGYTPSIAALRNLLDDKNDTVKYSAAAAIVRLTRAKYPGKPQKLDKPS